MPFRKLSLLFCLCFTVGVITHAQDVPAAESEKQLLVAWVDTGDVYLWRQGDTEPQRLTSGLILDVRIAPDGARLVYRETDGHVLPTRLTVITTESPPQIVLQVDQTVLGASEAPIYIADTRWADSSTVYFNTLRSAGGGFLPQDDLWRANTASGEVERLLPTGEGGAFSISPDGWYIALVRPGLYQDGDGDIRLLNTHTLEVQTLLAFPAISTGADFAFYPQVFWINHSLRVPIPDPDLLYQDGELPTTLWELGFDGTQTILGTVTASFFGQPRWSDDGAYLLYHQRRGEISTNQLDLVVAAGDGANPVVYEHSDIDTAYSAVWLPGSHQFLYSRPEPGAFRLGAPDAAPSTLPHTLFSPLFVDSTTYIYADAPQPSFELRAARLNLPGSTLISRVDNGFPIFDARIINTRS